MFKLESYITPLLMGYIDKYVKLNKEDFQLSLWGGDVVLNKVDLRLDVIEEALSLPITIKSGFIHELRIHVPWTRIYSEPVVITVNTIECILKLRGGSSSEDLETASSKSDASASKRPVMQPIRAAKVDEVDLPPGYIQSLINKIIHNVNIVINNLILKFVEDDIVLSLNVKSAECYSVNDEWKRSFVELMMPELMLRRVLDFHDLTVCLDKRNADGKIESYQEPVFYRCALLARMLMHYETLNSKLPQLIKLNVLCEKLDMSLTNVQLPMFYRLIDLCLALYYGTIDVPDDGRKKAPSAASADVPPDGSQLDAEQQEEGWISWMWSYVPAVLPADENAIGDVDESSGARLSKKSDVTVFVFGFYITEASLLLKFYELVHSSSVFASSSVKLVAKPFLLWEFSGLSLELKMRGEDFTDVQFGIRDSRLSVCNRMTTRSVDGGTDGKEKEGVFFRCSTDPTSSAFHSTYISGSLFDNESAENKGKISTYVFDEKEYLDTYNESTALHRFGIFWMSYLFTMVDRKDKTLIRFLIGPSRLSVSSIPVERVRKVVDILLNPEHESYSQPRKGRSAEEDLKSPTDEDLERFSDTSAAIVYRLTVLRPIVTIHEFDGNEISNRRHSRKTKDSQLLRQVADTSIHPTVIVEAVKVEMEITIPLYARLVAEAGFKIPSELLLPDNFYSRLRLKVVKLKASLSSILGRAPPTASVSSTIVQPSTIVFSKKSLFFPELWRNPLQPQLDLCVETEDGLTLNITKPQMLLLVCIINSWMMMEGQQSLSENELLTVRRSLVDDVFTRNSGNRMTTKQQQQQPQHPVIELSLSIVCLRLLDTEAVRSLTAKVSTIDIFLHGVGDFDGREFTVGVLSGPRNVSNIFSRDLFRGSSDNSSSSSGQRPTGGDEEPSVGDNNLFQLTLQMPKDSTTIQAPAAMYIDCRGLIACLDPRLHDWLSYQPSPREPSSSETDVVVMAVNPNIANATLPLIQRSPLGSESDRSVNESTESRTSFRVGSQHLQTTPSSNRMSGTSGGGEKRISSAEPLKEEEESRHQVETPSSSSWRESFVRIFPFVKILELQVNVDQWCFFFPSDPPLSPAPHPSASIGSMFSDLFIQRSLPDTLVVCCPAVYISSAGRKKSEEGHGEIPIKSLDHSIASEKLPWTFRLTNCSIYSIHDSQFLWNLVKPMSIGATLAVITKYQMPPSMESLAHLGLCIHTDLDNIRILCSSRQFQLIYRLVADFTSSTSDLLASLQLVTNQLSVAGKQVEEDSSMLNAETRQLESLRVANNTSSSVFDSTALTNDSEVARTMSDDTSADVRMFEESGNVRLTFWLQCTLTKLSFQLFALNEKQSEICIKSDLEDIAVAVDIQDVYSKAKCKFGSIGISHYMKRDSDWVTGDHEGILVFCTHHFKNSGPMIHHQHQSSFKSREFDPSTGADSKGAISARSHGFLDLTYTRARTESAARKLNTTFDGWTNGDKPSRHRYAVGVTYLDEICVTLQPLSLIYHGPLLAALLGVFTLPQRGHPTVEGTPSSEPPPKEDLSTHRPLLTSRNMPLLHVNVKELSLFFPDLEEEESAIRSSDIAIDDVCVLRIGSLQVIPQPENPLPRLVIEKNVYRSALHAGITGCPGSEVEDRQYQLNVGKLEICSSSWDDLVDCGRRIQKFTQSANIQNPAFEWNTVSMSGIADEVRVFPLLGGCDLRVVFAPAMVYGLETEQLQVVCGYSVEVNATTDLEFFLTVDQIRLLCRVLHSNVNATWGSDDDRKPLVPDSDSSEVSGRRLEGGGSNPFQPLRACTPFDVLLTGGKISMTLYNHEIMTTQQQTKDVMTANIDRPETSYRVIPFLFCLFSQPHLIIMCHSMSSQKIELSCYDVAINGCGGQDLATDSDRIVPVYSDFSVRWVETKPGKPDPNTGILRSFCTITLTNFLTSSACLEICIGRPLKVVASSLKVKQIIDLTSRINRALCTSHEDSAVDNRQQKTTEANTKEMLELIESVGVFSWLNHVSLRTVQLVAMMEFGSHDDRQTDDQSTAILLSLSGVTADLRSLFAETDQLRRMVLDLVLNDVIVKTGLCGSFTQLFGPASPFVTMTIAMMNCMGFPEWHRLIVFLRSESLPLQFSPENMLAIGQTQELLEKWIEEMAKEEFPKEKQQPNVSGRQSDVASHVTDQEEQSTAFKSVPISETYDDLKAEFFNYVTVECRRSVPNPGEILFFADKDASEATMTWRYYEPRVLTNVKAMQVPFSIQRHHSAAAFDESLQVPCVLQFSLSLGETFEDYSEFFLSQNQSSEAELPDVVANSNGSCVVAAEIWRVVMRMPPSDHQRHLSDEVELLVSPLTLAASLRVDSRFVSTLLPLFYVTSQIDCAQLRVFNHPSHLAKVESSVFSPYRLVSDVPKRELCVVTLSDFLLTSVSSSGHQHSQSHHIQMKTSMSCDVLEYRSLTLLPLLDQCSLSSEVTLTSSAKQPRLQVDVRLDKLFVRMSPSIVQTISDVVESWQNLRSSPKPQLMAFYIICNNTLQQLHFGQVETDEELVLPSQEAIPYSWRSTRARQLLRIMLHNQQPASSTTAGASTVASSNEVDIHDESIFCISLTTANGQESAATLVIKILKLSSTIKQVIISGLILFANQLDRPLQIKILAKNSAKDTTVVVAPGSHSATCIMDVGDLRAVRLGVTTSPKTGWSQEILISNAHNGLLIKVPLANPSDCVYIWCHVISRSQSTVATETMVVLCPLFVVKSRFPSQLLMNVKTPKLKAVTQLELEGRGLERQLEVGGRDLIHNITFQINSTTDASNPPLTLSADTIDQVERVCLGEADISKLSWLWPDIRIDDVWPYNAIEENTPSASQLMSQREAERRKVDSVDSPLLTPLTPHALDGTALNGEDQPNIELQVNLCQFWAGLNTLLIDVSPHWLFVNESGLDTVLIETDDTKSFRLPARRTIAPPVFKGSSFRIGVVLGGRTHLSDHIELSNEECNSGYAYPTEGLLYLDGHLQMCIDVCHDNILVQHCYLTLHSTYQHSMRIFTVRERFQFINRTPFDLQVYVTTIESAKDRKVFVPDDPHASLVVRGMKEPSDQVEPPTPQSLLLWNVLQASESRSNSNSEYFPHIRFRYLDSKSSSSGGTTGDSSSLPWCYPVRPSVSASSTGTRHSVALPFLDGGHVTTRPCVLTAVVLSQIVYLVLEEDFCPTIELINNCDVTIFFGQTASTAVVTQGIVIEEQLGIISNLPFVQPRSSCHYTLPIVDSLFPDIHDNLQSAKLHVGALNSRQELIWSQALDIHTAQSIFVVISKVSDLKVDIRRHGHTIRVHLNPVSRAEVSAKEIRSRIKGKSVVTVEEVGKLPRKKSVSRTVSETAIEAKDSRESLMEFRRQDSVVSDSPREEPAAASNASPHPSLQIEVSCFCREVSAVLFEELGSAQLAPFLCVTLDEVGILVQPKGVDLTQISGGVSGTMELFVCVYDLQVDNASFVTGDYDFPVLLKRSPDSPKSECEGRSWQNLRESINLLHGKAMISLSAELFQDISNSNSTSVQTLKLSVEPLLLLVEDTFCWNLLSIIDKLIPFSIYSADPSNKTSLQRVPLTVGMLSGSLASPLHLRQLCIDPISVQLSVHASLKLFISSDRAPLSFSQFERRNVCTNSHQLLRALAMHYAVSAIYRAALVFGSLGILGNPTGLVRSIGNGMADLIRLPYDGLTKGPGPCISGLGGGMKSVARHFSAGTLTSITNFASSISRNMERLSMDEEHIHRNEQTRRRRPSGLSEGLLNGLSGFGLSLLGAIAGVADQPLQTFTRSDSGSSSTSDKAKGVMSGFGKGLIGMVAKPLGGAAEFLSQTSLGLLQGIGLVDTCQPRHDESQMTILTKVGSAKYHEKVLRLLPSDEILFYVRGCHVTSRTVKCVCALVLTSTCFYVISEETEELLCTFPVSEISLRRDETSNDNDGSLRLSLRSRDEPNESNRQTTSSRLAAFIDDTTLAAATTLHSSDRTAAFDPIETKYEFHFDQRTMNTLIAWFSVAKNKNRRDSFPV